MIMIVDDDEPIRKSLQLLLTSEGYQVETASDGGDALKKLETVKPKIILLDIMMTPVDGLAFMQTLIERGIQKNYAIFIMTAMTDIIDKLKEMQGQGIIHDFMIKPFVFSEQFQEKIHQIVMGQ
ncbi:MAG TPA: response regulator [Ktedonobacteraceae bacterium]|jgi:DNA-binding response OmpR family regulator